MKNKTGFFSHISKSGFVRSVFTRILAIFITVSIIITAVAFASFTAEIRRSVLNDRMKQLSVVEDTISDKLGAIASIAYNIGSDQIIYMEQVETDPKSASEMAETLARYLVGNSFIEHLAFCRTSEPDVIYTSRGERSLLNFFTLNLGMSEEAASQFISLIHKESSIRVSVNGNGDNAYFSYSYPLPLLASEPQAHVLMLVPIGEINSLLETLSVDGHGMTAVFEANGDEIYRVGGDADDIGGLSSFLKSDGSEENYVSESGQKYVLQKVVAPNGWSYVSATRDGDTLSGLANKQLAFIILVLLILFAAIIIMLASIIVQFKPISNLAAQVSGDSQGVVDERSLLTSTIATLKDDSEQKQKYELAFYEAEAASKAKSAFLSSMSHDIRTPMNAIVGMTAIARKHIGDREYVDDCLKKVQVSSDYLLEIINNVLDMSRIESGRIPIAVEPVVIPALIDSVVSLMASSVEAKGQSLDIDIGALAQNAVYGDNIHIIQVFVNILSNAIKFTPEGGSLSIKVRQISDGDGEGEYSFAFTDNGIGIPPDFISHVFDTFSRADGEVSSRTEGTGLGMAIAMKLVELMNGTIVCESELGAGTTFTVTMRMKYADMDAATAISGESGKLHGANSDPVNFNADLAGRRILLVEDNAVNREIATKIISETGAEVIEVCNGKEAVEAFTDNEAGYFDLILMDLQMPVMNGYDATNAIRSSRKADAASVPIYAMTANTFDEDIRLVKSAGMNGHIGKPYTPQTLYRVLKEVLC